MPTRTLLMMFSLALPLLSQAGVNPKNGNFYISYTDITLESKGHELAINRTYNSKSSETGWFGYGWGSRYETRLVVMPDGSAAIKESGNGATTYYRTADKGDIQTGVKRIVEVATQRDQLSQADADKLAAQLMGDEELRLSKVMQYGIHVELLKGAVLGDVCGKASLKRITEGYQRYDCNRFGDSVTATDTFDLQGRLVRHELEDGYAVTIRYPDVSTAEIRDTLGQSIALAWTQDGHLAKAKTSDKELSYAYDDSHNLIESREKAGLSYTYAYDNNHNLTRITYIDNSSMFISYSPTSNGRADAVTNRDGSQTTYTYRTDPSNPNHYWTKITTISSTGEKASREYEFENQVTSTGVTLPAKYGQTSDGNTQRTKYDNQGRIIHREDKSGDYVEISYHPTLDKIAEVHTPYQTVKYDYDTAGKVIHVEELEGAKFDLAYDSQDEIRQIHASINDVSTELSITYDQKNRPVRMSVKDRGSLLIRYDEVSEVVTVQTEGGGNDDTLTLLINDITTKLKSLLKFADSALQL